MNLPNRHLAFVPPEKITGYLLNVDHPDGWGKAHEFRNRGYNESNSQSLASYLIAVAQNEPVSAVKETAFGFNYEVYGVIHPPTGDPLLILTVWFIFHEGSAPRLATAYPRQPRRRRDRRGQ